ncbi:MAG: hypothetical protein V7742_10775 [Halioglobus sp.]
MDNRRQQIVINKKLQHRYAVIVVLMTVVLTNVVIIVSSLLPGEEPPLLTSSLAWTIGGIELVLVLCAWFGSLKASHKIAGPVYVFDRELKSVGSGNLWARISLRERDEFQDEAASINTSLDALQSLVESVKATARDLQRAQASGQDTSEHVEKLVLELENLRTVKED